MRILVLYAHPVETSFHAALHARTLDCLRQAGHEVDDCDLYAEGFDPVLGREERLHYHDTGINRRPVEIYAERLLAAEALVLCFPIWSFGFPAILKGWFDRVLVPGVAFDMSDPAEVRPALTRLRRIVAVTTYGRSRWAALSTGDPARNMVREFLRGLTGGQAKVHYLAYYGMNVAKPDRLRRHLERVGRFMLRM